MGVYQESLAVATITRTIPGTALSLDGEAGILRAQLAEGILRSTALLDPELCLQERQRGSGERNVGSKLESQPKEPRNGI